MKKVRGIVLVIAIGVLITGTTPLAFAQHQGRGGHGMMGGPAMEHSHGRCCSEGHEHGEGMHGQTEERRQQGTGQGESQGAEHRHNGYGVEGESSDE